MASIATIVFKANDIHAWSLRQSDLIEIVSVACTLNSFAGVLDNTVFVHEVSGSTHPISPVLATVAIARAYSSSMSVEQSVSTNFGISAAVDVIPSPIWKLSDQTYH